MKKFLILTMSLFCFHFFSNAQEINELEKSMMDSIFNTVFAERIAEEKTNRGIYQDEIRNYINNIVSKNILVYRIANLSLIEDELYKGFLEKTSTFLNCKFFPDYGYRLLMLIDEVSDFQYPDTTFKLYSIRIRNEEYYNEKENIILSKDMGGIFNKYYLIALQQQEGLSTSISTKFDTVELKYTIKFISGDFYLNRINNDFDLDPKKPESFFEYIKFKTFDIQTQNIIFLRKKGKQLIFGAYSGKYDKNVNVIIKATDAEKILIK